ncbi:RNA polymerase-associated protein rtf1 [Dipsacomyces acuminosporus]|nr:RNA polymerase-associated protein rtf1 [Dipsacomyces acuminosporus]
MDNLENDILELFEDDTGAGRSSERSRSDNRSKGHSKRRRHSRDRFSGSSHRHSRHGDFSGSDSNVDMDTDADDFDNESSEGSDYGNSRIDVSDDDQPLDQWGEDLMGDQKDRSWLASLNEVDREQILAERQEKRDLLLERRELKMKLKAGNRGHAGDTSSRSHRTRGDSHRDSSGRSGAFSDLKRARERRRHGSPGRWSSSAGGEESESESEKEPTASLDEINSICLTRDQIEKWIFAPFFAKTIIGCFVRIVIRNKDDSGDYNQYRVMEVVDVVQGEGRDQPVYRINKTLTDKYVTLRFGALEKDHSMETVSNGPIKPEELSHWESTLRADRIRHRTTSASVQQKLHDLEKARNYQLTNADINAMISERKRLARLVGSAATASNPALERAELLQRRIEARQNGDWEKLEKIEARLAELDRQAGASAKSDAAGGHSNKSLLAPSTASRHASGGDGGTFAPIRRKKLITPTSSSRLSLHTMGAGASVSAASPRLLDSSKLNGIPLVPAVKVQELSLRSKVTPGYTDMMAANGGYDMSFIQL